MGTRRIKKKEGLKDFSDKTLIPELENKYVNAHLALTNRNKDELHELITEHAFSVSPFNLFLGTELHDNGVLENVAGC